MRPLPFVWPYALVFWAIYVWALIPEWKIMRSGREGAGRADSKDSGSIKVMVRVMSAALLIAFPLAFVDVWDFPKNQQVPLFAAGVAMMVLGSVLRRHCWRTLGEYFTGDVRARPNQRVISSGPYRLVRHPSYTAGMMMFIGIGLALGSWLSLMLLTVATIATYSYRVAIEERVLLDTIGEPYGSYMKGRKRFIPYVV
jgi:protein-S-isoprenylcysteine O-methyltransferase